MSKNHMAEVAKILGVELGEPFEILANNICPPDANSHLCEDICYKNIRCVDCWREWHKSKLNEVRQNDK